MKKNVEKENNIQIFGNYSFILTNLMNNEDHHRKSKFENEPESNVENEIDENFFLYPKFISLRGDTKPIHHQNHERLQLMNGGYFYDEPESRDDDSQFAIEFLEDESERKEVVEDNSNMGKKMDITHVEDPPPPVENTTFRVFVRPSRKKNVTYSEIFPENASVMPHWYQIVIEYPHGYEKTIIPNFFLKLRGKSDNAFKRVNGNGYLKVKTYDARRTRKEFKGRKIENRMIQFGKKTSARNMGGKVLKLCVEDIKNNTQIWESTTIKKLYVRRSVEEVNFWENYIIANKNGTQRSENERNFGDKIEQESNTQKRKRNNQINSNYIIISPELKKRKYI